MFKEKLECKHCRVYLDLIYRLVATIERQAETKKQKEEREKRIEGLLHWEIIKGENMIRRIKSNIWYLWFKYIDHPRYMRKLKWLRKNGNEL